MKHTKNKKRLTVEHVLQVVCLAWFVSGPEQARKVIKTHRHFLPITSRNRLEKLLKANNDQITHFVEIVLNDMKSWKAVEG